LQNISGKDQQLTFGSGQKYDIFVFNEQEEIIYRWSHDKAFTTAIIDINLNKADSLTFTEEWDLKDNNGNVVPKGHYSICIKVLATIKIENNQRMINPEELVKKSVIEIK
jgi:flagellar hook assembly protein FlgD